MGQEDLNQIVEQGRELVHESVDRESEAYLKLARSAHTIREDSETNYEAFCRGIENLKQTTLDNLKSIRYSEMPSHLGSDSWEKDFSLGIDGVKIEVKYSGVPKTSKIVSLLRGAANLFIYPPLRGDVNVSLNVSIDDMRETESLPPLTFQISERDYDWSEDQRQDIAKYLHQAVKHSVVKSKVKASEDPSRADIDTSFETNLVYSVACALGSYQIVDEYEDLLISEEKKSEFEGLVRQLKEGGAKLTEELSQKQKDLEQRVGSLMDDLEERAKDPSGELARYVGEKIKGIDRAVKEVMERLQGYESRERTKVDEELEQEYSKRKESIKRDISELEEQLAERRAEINKRKGDLTCPDYFTREIDQVFPDYDPDGTKHDVFQETKAIWGRRLLEIASKDYNQFKAEELMEILKALSKNVKKELGGQKFGKVEIDEMVKEVDWIARYTPFEDHAKVIEIIDRLGNKRKQSLDSVNTYFAELLGVKPRKIIQVSRRYY